MGRVRRGGRRATNVSTGERRAFLERPVAVVTFVSGVLGIIGALVGLVGIPGGDGEDEREKIDACVGDHGLSRPLERTEVAEGRVLFRGCTWPPPPGAAADGFMEITMSSRDGPGQSEAEGLTVADFFTTSCTDIEVIYLFNNMGTFVPEQPVRLTKGEIRRVEGGSIWFPRNDAEASIFTPGRDQSVVLSNLRYKIDSARCTD